MLPIKRLFLLAPLPTLFLACTDGTGVTALRPEDASFSRQPVVAAISIAPNAASIVVNGTLKLVPTATNAKGAPLSNVRVSWGSDDAAVARVSNAGVVTGVAAGTVRITAAAGGALGAAMVTVTSPPTPPPPGGPPPAQTGWTFCTAAGAPCDFIGLRDVRLGAANGPYVQQTAYHNVPCAAYGFAGQNPAPNQALHCDYGPIKTTSLVNPQPGMGGLGTTAIVPLGAPGAAGPRIQSEAWNPPPSDGSGAFRTTCSLAAYAFDDPIVYPGQPGASHLHSFFGNTGISAASTPQSVASSGNSTCRGGTLNRTAYWVPAVVDARTGEVQPPDEAIFYYKTGYNIDAKVLQPPPVGLRMIAGNKLATGPQDNVSWYCRDHNSADLGAIPNCPAGDAVVLTVSFPQCWDGKNLDSPDHKSHMAYPNYRNPPQVSSCPATHPVTLPAITEIFTYPVSRTTSPASWRLSSDMYSASLPGGFSAHADWMGGWDPETMKTIVTRCLNKALDCGVGSIGDGRNLY
ncbi:MAG: hypothetical protein V7647_221 [Acidobacteriota bacterium]